MTPLDEVLGTSPGIQAVRATLMRVLALEARRRTPPLLILGDTGTGKGLLARVLHRAGSRGSGPLVEVNCAAIPESLLEAELFGFERGAFTGAHRAKPGLFQAAHGGTLFLDEVGLASPGVQAKLLKVLEERTVRRLGSTRSEPTDVLLVAATSEDLQAGVQSGRFREDLYHRLSVVVVRLPPLAARGADIVLLAEHFLARACTEYGVPPKTLSAEAQAALLAFRWPGNIRELANVMERVALLDEAPLVTATALHLPAETAPASVQIVGRRHRRQVESQSGERDELLSILAETRGNVAQAAARLRMPRGTLRYRIEKLGLRMSPVSEGTPGRLETEGSLERPPRIDAPLQWTQRRLAFLRIALMSPADQDVGSELAAALESFSDKVTNFGGRVEERGPRNLIAVFGLYPIEDAAQRAAHAALTVRQAARRAQQTSEARPMTKLAIHVAPALIGQAGEFTVVDVEAKQTAYGVLDALTRAAEPDTVLVSAAAVPSLKRRFDLAPIPTTVPAGGPAWRLEGLEPSKFTRGGLLTPFVGRDHELELLRARLRVAMHGQGQVISLVGEPGIGKSRLLSEFRRLLATTPVTVLEGHCPSYGSARPYLPVAEMLRSDCQVTDLDPPDLVTRKVRQRIGTLGLATEEALPYLLKLLGIDSGTEHLARLAPDAIRLETFEHLRQMMLRGSRDRPLVVVVEDLHWIDTASEAYLASLSDVLAAAPVLLVATYRPGYSPPWRDRSYATQVALPPLPPEDSLRVVRAVWQTQDVPESVAQRLLAKGEGNPFFLEELSWSVRERPDLLPVLSIPDTVQDVLLARIDRLPADVRAILQMASVIGRTVPATLLQALAATTALDAPLSHLTQLEFLSEQRTAEGPTVVFKHALTQEVAYHSLDVNRRRQLHRQLGLAIETLYADRRLAMAEVLSHHFSSAEVWDKAFVYLRQAAERAAGALATREALALYDRVLATAVHLDPEPDQWTRLEIHRARADLLFILGHFARARTERERVVALARELGDPVAEGDALAGMGMASAWAQDFDLALMDAREAIVVGERAQAHGVLAAGRAVTSLVYSMRGRLEEAWTHAEPIPALGRQAGDPSHEALGLSILGEIRNFQGEYDKAVQFQSQAVQVARAHHLVEPLLWALFSYGVTLTGRGDYEQALARFEEGLTLSGKIGEEVWRHRLLNSLGWLYGEIGDLECARVFNQRGVDEARPRGDPETISNAELNLADLCVAQGQLVEAHDWLDRVHSRVRHPATSDWMKWRYSMHLFASLGELWLGRHDLAKARALGNECLELATRTQSRKYLVRGWRLVGEIAVAAHDSGDAEVALQRALAVAMAIGNPTQLWKTHVACGRLYRATGRPDAAQKALALARETAARIKAQLSSADARATFEQSPLIRPVYAEGD